MLVMENVSQFGENLKRIMVAKNVSGYELAKLSKVDEGYISKLINGKVTGNVTDKIAVPLARALNVTTEELRGTKKTSGIPSPHILAKDVAASIQAYIPVYGEIHAGEGMEPIDYVAMSRVRPAPETMKAYRIKGLCLEPDIIDGDTVIVDEALTPDDGDLVVCVIDGTVSIKRYRENKRGKYLENNGGTYRPEECNTLGVVTEVNRKLR